MFVDARGVEMETMLKADICIVGAGAAGIAIALDYIGSRLRVAVIESGGFDYEAETQQLLYGPVIGLPYFPLMAARLRYFGGTTNHWGGVCRPMEDIDFEARKGVPYTGWPLRKTDLEPFYGPAVEICAAPSKQWHVNAWARQDRFAPLPLDSNRVVTRVAQLVSKSARSFGARYKDQFRRARNVTVYLHANVISIQTDDAGANATSVRVATLSGRRFSVAAKLFVLAVGGIENPRLLLTSNANRPNGLGNQHDLVGRFFSEHPRFIAGMVMLTNPRTSVGFYDPHYVGDSRIKAYLSPANNIKLAEGLMDVQIRMDPVFEQRFAHAKNSEEVESLLSLLKNIRHGEEVPDLGRHLMNVVKDLSRWHQFSIPGAPIPLPYPEVLRRLMRASRTERERLIPALLGNVAASTYIEFFGAPIERLLLTTRIEQAPNPDSRVKLISERDQLGVPRVALDWRLSDIDKYHMRRALEILGAEFGRAGLGRLKILREDGAPGWPKDLAGGWHLMGTTRMHDDPRQGVVDRNCRIHGMSNLYVAGSSVFPTGGSGTPTLTLVALALRLAKHMKDVLR